MHKRLYIVLNLNIPRSLIKFKFSIVKSFTLPSRIALDLLKLISRVYKCERKYL